MRAFALSAAALTMALAMSIPAEAARGHSGHSGHSGMSRGNSRGNVRNGSHYRSSHPNFSRGRDNRGRFHNWSRYCWSSRYGCYCYYDTSCSCWYTWSEPRCCFCPCSSVSETSPVVAAPSYAPPAPVGGSASATATATATASAGAP
jgi:hypothetical protein